MMASLVPDTVIYISDFSLCSRVGLITSWPSTLPTATEPVGPSHGISEVARATDEPIIPQISGEQSRSTDMTVATTTTSL